MGLFFCGIFSICGDAFFAANGRTLQRKLIPMIPFHTSILVDGHFAEYRISYEEDVYKAELLAYKAARPYAPPEIIFWKVGSHWMPRLAAHSSLVDVLGSLIDIYLFKAATFKTS